MRQLLFAPFLIVAVALPAAAQVVLPGAVAPTPEGASGAPATPASLKPAKAKAHRRPGTARDAASPPTLPPARILPATSLAGQTLFLDGHGSEISFDLRDKALVVSHLSLKGRGDDGAACQVDVADLPLATEDQGQPSGMARIGVALPACPVTFDILDGAALATSEGACAFQATHCRVDPTGLWGPPSTALGPDRDKLIERERARADAAVRNNFKRLLTTTKDRPTIANYAREQAQFSSTREETCRIYAGEEKHGFCATRLTEARAAALRAKADVEAVEKAKHRKGRSPGRARVHAGAD